MDGHWETWKAKLPGVESRPSEIFRRQCFVSMDPDDEGAAAAVASVGEQVLVWASDYPHVDAPFPGAVTATLRNLSQLSEATRRSILRDNALRLYALD